MPYIKPERRPYIYDGILAPNNIETVGELNFAITSVCINWAERNGISYKTVNDIVGALECAKLELYRRLAAPYEDEKIKQNGDVYPV